MQNLVVAAAQFQNENGDKEKNLGHIRALTQTAAGMGAEVVSFHEGSVTGYTFVRKLSRSELLKLAEPVPDGESTDRLIETAKEYNVHLLAGLVEKDEADRLNKRRKQSPTEMRALDILRAAVPRDGILVCDRCNLGYWAYRCLPVYTPRTFQYPKGYGGLGGALPQALGAKLACPEKAVVCVIGDGGFQFTATELAVAIQENISVTIILCNNNAYGAIRAKQDKNFGGRRFGTTLKNPDFQKLAAAYGIPSTRADTLEAFEHALRRAIEAKKLNLIELTVELSDP